MKMNKVNSFIVSMLMLSVVFSGLIYYRYNLVSKREHEVALQNGISIYLKFDLYRKGLLIQSFTKENDLILDNFGQALRWWMISSLGTFTDDQGHSGTLGGASHNPGCIDAGSTYIAIGTGTSAPTRTDYILQDEVMRSQVYAFAYAVSSSSMNSTVTSFFTFTGSYAITEAGLCAYCRGTLNDEVFFTRDTFTAINVVATDTLGVSIIWRCN